MYNEVFSHSQLSLLRMFFIWQPVSTSNISHHQATVQKHKCIQQLNTMKQEISAFTLYTQLEI